MNVLHISTTDEGGAAIAAVRLHDAMRKGGIDSKFLVLFKYGARADVLQFTPKKTDFVLKKLIGRLNKQKINSNEVEIFTTPDTYYDLARLPIVKEADIIHLHWVSNFVDYSTFFSRVKQPIVWTFHDLNPILGGFHYMIDKATGDDRLQEYDKIYAAIKAKAISGKNITVTTPSEWLKAHVLKSKLRFKEVYKIHYCIDASVFAFESRNEARKNFGLPFNKSIFLAVASDFGIKRKGFGYLLDVIDRMKGRQDVIFLIVGNVVGVPKEPLPNVVFAGRVTDECVLKSYYAAADGFVIPSIEDNLPNVMLEALTVGCPVLGFNVGGISEVVIPFSNGLLSLEASSQGLYEIIEQFLEVMDSFDRRSISNDAQEKFAERRIVDQVVSLYDELLN
jgi:glycosyltransferase involved in cell wall biosynthesis